MNSTLGINAIAIRRRVVIAMVGVVMISGMAMSFAEGSVQTLVAPNEGALTDGPGADLPFVNHMTRLQNIYNGSQFSSSMPQGGIITQIAFRIDQSDRNSLSAVMPSLEIHMSTAPTFAQNISPVWANNVGQDETVVFPKGPIAFMVAAAKLGPNPFELRIPLPTSFFYDPRRGSLSIDLYLYAPADGNRLLVDTSGTQVAAQIGEIGAPTSVTTTAALVLQVGFIPVPEAPIACIMGMGLFLLLLSRRFA